MKRLLTAATAGLFLLAVPCAGAERIHAEQGVQMENAANAQVYQEVEGIDGRAAKYYKDPPVHLGPNEIAYEFYNEPLEVEKPKIRGLLPMVLGVIMLLIVTFAIHANAKTDEETLQYEASTMIFETFDTVNEFLENQNLPFPANVDIWVFLGGVLLVATGMNEFIQSLIHRRHLRKGIRTDALPPLQGLYLLLAGITSLGGWTLTPHAVFIAHLGVPCVVVGTFLFLYSLIERIMYTRAFNKAQAQLPLQHLAFTSEELQ